METTLIAAAQTTADTDHDNLLTELELLSQEQLAMVGGGQGMFIID
jgi:hypothetical protein